LPDLALGRSTVAEARTSGHQGDHASDVTLRGLKAELPARGVKVSQNAVWQVFRSGISLLIRDASLFRRDNSLFC